MMVMINQIEQFSEMPCPQSTYCTPVDIATENKIELESIELQHSQQANELLTQDPYNCEEVDLRRKALCTY